YLLAGTLLARGLLCWGMSAAINNPVTLLPAAFGILVLQKSYGVVRASVTPRLLPAEITLVTANARSQLITLTTSLLARGGAARARAAGGSRRAPAAGPVVPPPPLPPAPAPPGQGGPAPAPAPPRRAAARRERTAARSLPERKRAIRPRRRPRRRGGRTQP